MMKSGSLCLAFLLGTQVIATAREAKLVRYPDYHGGKIAFAYLGDIWVADEDGKNIATIDGSQSAGHCPAILPGWPFDRVFLRS